MENQNNKDLDGSWRNTRDFARQGKLDFKLKDVRVRHDHMDEISALEAQLEDSKFQQHLYRCKWAAAERKSCDFKAQLEDVRIKFKYSTVEAEGTIKELKEQLERASSNETKSYQEEIHKLKFELNEAGIVRINAVNRLILADTIMARLNIRLDEASEKLNSNPAEDPRPGPVELQQQLLNTKKDLKEQAAKQEALCCQIQKIRSKLSTKVLKEKSEVCVQDLEEEVKNLKADYLAKLEQQQEENSKLASAVQRVEEEKVSLQQTLQTREDEWAQREAAMQARLDEIQSTM
ncbi:A-kinase anchor protein 9-like [Centropristis striata]|uniref:A-kinase anchor protein 9-like n=1 Tax=Centropristis striata TaxID=184440 RepID=UPI0027E07E9B|nr:A-kinase anchor protein 9-like [Centropristis striata]